MEDGALAAAPSSILYSPSPADAAAICKKRRRVLIVLLAVVATALAVGVGWWSWRRWMAPTPPEIALAGADPAVASAIEKALGTVRREPHSVEAWGHLGKLLRACDYVPEGIVCFAQAERLAPNDPRWAYLQGEGHHIRGQAQEALPHLRRAAQLCDQQKANLLAPRLRLAEALLATGHYDEAAAHLARAQEIEPDHPSVHWNLAQLSSARQEWDTCRSHLLRCVHSPFTEKKACNLLAAICSRLGDKHAAGQFQQRAAAAPADVSWPDPWVENCLGLSVGKPARFRYIGQLQAQGLFREAIALLQELLTEGPDYRAYVLLGKELAKIDLAAAEQTLRTAIELSPKNVDAYYLLSKVLWTQAEQRWHAGAATEALALFRAAAEQARQAIERKPDWPKKA